MANVKRGADDMLSDDGSQPDSEDSNRRPIASNNPKFNWKRFDATVRSLLRAQGEEPESEEDSVHSDESGRSDVGGADASDGDSGPPSPPPPKSIQLNGEYKYIKYIPSWSDPDWRDQPDVTIRSPGGTETSVPRRDVTQLIRPAILPQDAAENPTQYALRFGINPDVGEGRSRMSPDLSASRTARLTADTGAEISVNAIDFTNEIHKRGGIGALFAAMDAVREDDPMYARFQAMKKFREMLVDDKEYQRFFHLDITTDERITHEVDPVHKAVPQSNLSGPIHPLFERKKWIRTEDRGTTEDEPRFLYNICGTTGEYTPHDDFIWAAMQPGLQLATRVISMNHPYWHSILDIFCYQQVDPNRDPRPLVDKTDLFSVFDRFEPGAPPILGQQRDNFERRGFDSAAPARVAAQFLAERLDLIITSCGLEKNEKTTWGVTYAPHDREVHDMRITMEINAEIIWPLLVPQYTAAEKAMCSFMLGATLLHELAHAAHSAVQWTLQDPVETQPLFPLMAVPNGKVLEDLGAFAYNAAWSTESQPYWKDESRAEQGYAFENVLWGGEFGSSLGGHWGAFPAMQMMAINLHLSEWPSADSDGLDAEGLKKDYVRRPGEELNYEPVLLTPPLRLETYVAPFLVDEVGRLFQQDFWNTKVAKFGVRALRFGQDRAPWSTTQRRFYRGKHLLEKFGSAGVFLRTALRKLKQAKQVIVAEFIYETLSDHIEPVTVRKRWYLQSAQWTSQDQAVVASGAQCNDTFARLMAALQRFDTTRDSDDARACAVEAGQLASAATDLHRMVLAQVRDVQAMVVDYLRQKPADRILMYRRYGTFVHDRLQDPWETMVINARTQTEDALQVLTTAGLAQRDISVTESFTRLTALLNMDLDLLQECRKHLGKESLRRRGPVPEVFATVPSSGYRKRNKRLENLAVREMQLMPGPIREVVDKCLEILRQGPVQVREPPLSTVVGSAPPAAQPQPSTPVRFNPHIPQALSLVPTSPYIPGAPCPSARIDFGDPTTPGPYTPPASRPPSRPSSRPGPYGHPADPYTPPVSRPPSRPQSRPGNPFGSGDGGLSPSPAGRGPSVIGPQQGTAGPVWGPYGHTHTANSTVKQGISAMGVKAQALPTMYGYDQYTKTMLHVASATEQQQGQGYEDDEGGQDDEDEDMDEDEEGDQDDEDEDMDD